VIEGVPMKTIMPYIVLIAGLATLSGWAISTFY
jgi:hypothetical protein